MTATAPPLTAIARASDARPSRTRRVLTFLGLGLAVTIAVLILALVSTSGPSDASLHPEGVGPEGTRALVTVLGEQGVDVVVATSTDEALDAVTGSEALVVVGNTGLWTTPSAEHLLADLPQGVDVVFLDGAPQLLGDLDVGVRARTAMGTDTSADCELPWAEPGSVPTRADVAFVPEEGPDLREGDIGCFTDPVDDDPASARYLAVAVTTPPSAQDTSRTVTLVGFPSAATNRFIVEDANAAVMLRLLGAKPTLVWLHPSASDALSYSEEPDDVWPSWLDSIVVLMGIAVLALAFAQGRRLGRLVPEDLPVVVKAVESTHGRAELYRAGADRARASYVLRLAAAGRLAARLGVPRTAPITALVSAVAAHTGMPTAQVAAALTGPAPETDEQLVALAQQLAHLEEKVHHP